MQWVDIDCRMASQGGCYNYEVSIDLRVLTTKIQVVVERTYRNLYGCGKHLKHFIPVVD